MRALAFVLFAALLASGVPATAATYGTRDEAVAMVNDAGYGLAGTVWTCDPEHGGDIARRIHVGTFGVNLYTPDLGAPWGGGGSGRADRRGGDWSGRVGTGFCRWSALSWFASTRSGRTKSPRRYKTTRRVG